jgi:hypothetical protein
LAFVAFLTGFIRVIGGKTISLGAAIRAIFSLAKTPRPKSRA